jgi:hypothetical protein
MKTSELSGVALDWAVARCEVGAEFIGEIDDPHFYSTDWALAGPIIERERIELRDAGGDGWAADDNLHATQYGDTPLIATMRCYVASKLGEDIEVPAGLSRGQA